MGYMRGDRSQKIYLAKTTTKQKTQKREYKALLKVSYQRMINQIEIIAKSIYKRINERVTLMVANEINLLDTILYGLEKKHVISSCVRQDERDL